MICNNLQYIRDTFRHIIAEFYGKREGWWNSCTGKLFRENIEQLRKEHRAWFNAKYSFEQSLPLSMHYGYVEDPLAELKTRLKSKTILARKDS